MCAESSTRVPGDMGDGVDVAVAWGDKAAAAQKKRAMARAGDVASASKAANRLPLALRCGGSIVRYCSPIMVGLYPLLCTSVLATLRCVRINGTYDHPEARWVVAAQPYLTCLGSEHFSAAVLAIVSLVVFVIGFPACTLVDLIWHRDKWRPCAHASVDGGDTGKSAASGTGLRHVAVPVVAIVGWLPGR